MKTLVLFTAVCVVFFACSDDNPASASVIATELWRLNDIGTPNFADLTFCKLSNTAVSVSGKWYYQFYGYQITCTFMSGSAIFSDSMTINARGTAAYPPDSAGYVESSPFTLMMKGIFRDSTAIGRWEIHFDKAEWEGWINPNAFRKLSS